MWDSFMYQMKTLSERRVKSREAANYFSRLFNESAAAATALTHERAMKNG